MALKGSRLGLPHRVHGGRSVEAHAGTAPRHKATRGDLELRSLIAHGIGLGGGRRQGSSLPPAATTTTLLLSVRFATGDYPADLNVDAISGDTLISSSEPLLEKVDARIDSITVGYPDAEAVED